MTDIITYDTGVSRSLYIFDVGLEKLANISDVFLDMKSSGNGELYACIRELAREIIKLKESK